MTGSPLHDRGGQQCLVDGNSAVEVYGKINCAEKTEVRRYHPRVCFHVCFSGFPFRADRGSGHARNTHIMGGHARERERSRVASDHV